MPGTDSQVLIVGCGAAGVTAAIGLARRGIPVCVIEGAPYPGAENWSGAVYFCENLARPEILGEDLLRQTPLERRIVRRGILATDGRVATGLAVDNRRGGCRYPTSRGCRGGSTCRSRRGTLTRSVATRPGEARGDGDQRKSGRLHHRVSLGWDGMAAPFPFQPGT